MIVVSAAGSVLYAAFQSLRIAQKLQDDQYNARMALLGITREIHRGFSQTDITITGTAEANDKALMIQIDYDAYITYRLMEGMLTRTITSGYDSTVNYIPVKIDSFFVDFGRFIDKKPNTVFTTDKNTRFISIAIVCSDETILKTSISISRIPE